MTKTPALIQAIQRKVAVSAIPASAVRGLRTPGVVAAARGYFAAAKLGRFSTPTRLEFRRRLDNETLRLERALPPGADFWGVARKALNLFLRDAAYNVYLRRHFGLAAAEKWYEVPLDAVVAEGLKAYDADRRLPPWRGVKYLTPDVSRQYQDLIRAVAQTKGIAPVHLDAYLWTAGR